ncbi:MAG TPA: tetraacyldisaccharide 4'-kinase [Ohtaekwangia sp.]|uniref:tetraacyldisaccharide 4'-kinase n=1 Tax=Ohtaekwangia sp. TaxID=2066019 RepID=UPI002F9325ED
MIVLRILFFLFAILYDLVTSLRNTLYNRGIKPSASFDIPVICVGNLTVGGTGKTPMIEHLIRLLYTRYPVATLSRGYGRKTKGFRIAGEQDDADTLGDEPAQFYRKFAGRVTVAVGEDRAFAIPNILQEREDTRSILLDDAYQHRRVKPSFTILLSDYNQPFYNDYLLPAGRLRESRSNASRADVIVVTKCPEEISDEERMVIEQQIRKYAACPVFFSGIRYGQPVSFGKPVKQSDSQVIIVTGIAKAAPFVSYIAATYTVVKHVALGDHHVYTTEDFTRLHALAKEYPQASFITTEKDMVKMISAAFNEQRATLPLFYIPIEVKFLKNGQDFDAMILNAVPDELNPS